jgi:hypothetical protein
MKFLQIRFILCLSFRKGLVSVTLTWNNGSASASMELYKLLLKSMRTWSIMPFPFLQIG